ncbi:MAG: monofunctional biosynthetic peptidoglycan transglycosylase [Chlorobiaceae bacterium]|jgi:monofunctional glycosyltransferase|nr:monofunctional biosynthetic peptidoglycan transglycosylase [Chlorobiaceae bacterium]
MKLVKNLFILLLLFFIADIARYAFYPDIGRLAYENPKKSAFMLYREAEWEKQGLYEKTIKQQWVPIEKVSPNLIKAVLIAEDDKFWQHEGFDYKAIGVALEKNIAEKKFKMGGSTISQQLSKNLFLSPSKNPIRKIKEAILTWRIEKTLTKRRILELYINVAEWGDGIFGIEQAARHYYGVSAAQLTAQQASKLASVLPNPIRFSPKGSSAYVHNRSRKILAIMRKRGLVLPDYEAVMTIAQPDTTAVDSVTIGIPQELIDQAASPDSSRENADENGHVMPDGTAVQKENSAVPDSPSPEKKP